MPSAAPVPAREQAQTLLEQLFKTVAGVKDYTLVMDKQQRIKGELKPQETLAVKHRRSPECSYMRWIGKLHKGREMIYCPHRYDGKIQAHDSGLLGFITVSIKPDGDFYLRTGQLHTIQDTGLFALTRLVHKDYDYLQAHPDLPPPTIIPRIVKGAPSTCLEIKQGADLFDTYHPGQRLLCLDDRLHLPTELEVWNTDGQVMEHYLYSDYGVNVGLTDEDFDTDNKDYHF